MFRDSTFDELNRAGAIDDAATSLVMDEDTFRAFYDRTARGVWAYLARITGDRHLADDLLQETFYRFLRADATYDSEAHRRNSIYRIATNLASDARRRSRLLRPMPMEQGEIEERMAGDPAGRTDRSMDVNRALARMKPRERAILWLAYAEGASHQEIAGVLGLRTASLKPMLFRARRRLAKLLGRKPEGAA